MTDFEQRYVTARKAVIARDLARLNPMQRQGAMTTEGPLLLLAGAGSGKTTVLIQRVYNLLTYGRGSDSDEVPDWATEEDLAFLEQFPDRPDGDEVRRVHRLCAVDAPRPWEIIAITFTNKAAGELKDRLAARLGPEANDIWASTFHSACVRILRRDIDRLGFTSSFTIYDTADSERVIKDIVKEEAVKLYEAKEAEFPEPEQLRELERVVLLKCIDSKWMDHIDDMEMLRQGIGLMAYGQRDPVVEYKMNAFEMFNNMITSIQEDTVRMLYHVHVEQKIEREQVAKVTGTNKDDSSVRKPVQRKEIKVYPNDPCPCGSGKKYKQCCGRKTANV